MVKKQTIMLSLLLGLSSLATSGCLGLVAGSAATVGIATVQEGGLSAATSDARIQITINDLWFRYDVDVFRKLDMTVNQGRVLLTGVVQDPEHRVEAVRLAWQPAGVKQVINEIRVADSTGVLGFARDSWITTQLRSKLTFNKEVLSINYNIDTVQGSVYLLGVAQNQAELNRVIEIARTIPNVKQVVSYVKLAGQEQVDGNARRDSFRDRDFGAAPDNYNDQYSDQYDGGSNSAENIEWGGPPSNLSAPVDLTGGVNSIYSAGSYEVEPLSPAPSAGRPVTSEQLLNSY